ARVITANDQNIRDTTAIIRSRVVHSHSHHLAVRRPEDIRRDRDIIDRWRRGIDHRHHRRATAGGAVIVSHYQRHRGRAQRIRATRLLPKRYRVTAIRVERAVVYRSVRRTIRSSRNNHIVASRHRRTIQHHLEEYAASTRSFIWGRAIQRATWTDYKS